MKPWRTHPRIKKRDDVVGSKLEKESGKEGNEQEAKSVLYQFALC